MTSTQRGECRQQQYTDAQQKAILRELDNTRRPTYTSLSAPAEVAAALAAGLPVVTGRMSDGRAVVMHGAMMPNAADWAAPHIGTPVVPPTPRETSAVPDSEFRRQRLNEPAPPTPLVQHVVHRPNPLRHWVAPSPWRTGSGGSWLDQLERRDRLRRLEEAASEEYRRREEAASEEYRRREEQARQAQPACEDCGTTELPDAEHKLCPACCQKRAAAAGGKRARRIRLRE